MAITRRQFVTRLGALAAAVGMSQADLSKVTEAFAHAGPTTSWTTKPKVIWVHGAECTGDSVSLLSLFEDVRAPAIEGNTTTTLTALDVVAGGTGDGAAVLYANKSGLTGHPFGHRTLWNSETVTGSDFDNQANNTAYIANIADVLIDFIDLQYHETVMGMGGDLAYQFLLDNMNGSSAPFVMVVEGSVQDRRSGGYWNRSGDALWCSIGQNGVSGEEAGFDEVVASLATQAKCAAVVAIGQCASYGGYPACESPVLKAQVGTTQPVAGAVTTGSMTQAKGVYDFLDTFVTTTATTYASGRIITNAAARAAANKVINVPGCPANPWWFVLTVVAWLVDFVTVPAFNGDGLLGILHRDGAGALSINGSAIDGAKSRRLKAVFGTPIHGPACPRYQDYLRGTFAARPGDSGCLQLIGCKGPATNSLCAVHGWNSMQPHNDPAWEDSITSTVKNADGRTVGGSFCVAAGHPCMGCTEPGYPDKVVPFVVR